MEENNKNILEKIETNKTPQNVTVNQQFNVNIFLNEECKNAMNLGDFMGNIMITMDDLKYTKDNGFVIGISNIFKRHLGVLAVQNDQYIAVIKRKCIFMLKVKMNGKRKKENV